MENIKYIINQLKEATAKGYNILKPEMRELVEQIIKYKAVSNTVMLLVWFIIFGICLTIIIKHYSNLKIYILEDDPILFLITFSTIGFVVSSFLLFMPHIFW